ncbi:transformation/transcription domain-associated protein-like isoform X2 [Ornithodoros turicata]|uniref:transformation/transcription domain-associated protein-like isoform X2 n=1 Tax=Ornithodoros turicata TaxID=34597 RepID=UPI0031395E60
MDTHVTRMQSGGAQSMTMDPVAQINTYRSFVFMLDDPGAKDESKLKAVQELSEDLETIVTSVHYPTFLDHAMHVFLKILQEGKPQFIAEHNMQQLRKLLLEIIHRIPTNEHLRPYVKQTLSLMFELLKVENEENVLVCLRIIIELHKQFRPPFNPEIKDFLQFVKNIYKELPSHLNKIFEPRPQIKVKDLAEVNLEALLQETFTLTNIQVEKKAADGTCASYNVVPRAVLSLKVLAELPIIVVLMYQLYKQGVHQDVAEFIPLILSTITLQPRPQDRLNPAFNKEVFVDFMAAQIKTLSFLAYIVKIYQDVVSANSSQLAKGLLGLLVLCPQEVAHLRKELLIAARHILATELRNKFVGCIEQLFDENILIGTGWTAYESLRPLAYSTLADLVHHVRTQLALRELSAAVAVFSRNVHDESLPTSIQTMSCKLLLNLVECIRTRSDQEGANGRELLIRMLEVFVLKFNTIAKLQLPTLMQKGRQPAPTGGQQAGQQAGQTQPGAATLEAQKVPLDEAGRTAAALQFASPLADAKEEKANSYTVSDCRSLVKTLVCGVKTITWGIGTCRVPGGSLEEKQFQPQETLVFIRLVKYALQALDIYTLQVPNAPAGGQAQQLPRNAAIQSAVRSKEEKEVLDHFGGVFTMMSPLTFREVFSTTIEYVVERLNKNSALQIVANFFLANKATSPIFATILVEYLLDRMEEMGSNPEKSNLYLKLFKLVFGSVSLFAAENELMLKPHLHKIVNRSMSLALSAREPYNYFLLLRALFRSIGGGSHDLLYQEFLPLLPTLLQGLNGLQSGLHKQHMKDLFVELCLTVPVRLSSLLPYLPMLMDPLVSALNGSQTLVSQGLRTLELCVDNLQPDFLYEHIQPVRAELMQALWRTLRNPADHVAQVAGGPSSQAQVAFRVLGKFGGGNRKMLREPQKLEYNDKDAVGPCITVYFQDYKSPIALPVEKIIETAFNALKASGTDSFYRRQCWEITRGFLVGQLELEDDRQGLLQLFSHPSFGSGEIAPTQGNLYKCTQVETRKVHKMALTGMFAAAAIKELHNQVLPFLVSLVSHYTLVAISQQAGPFRGSQTGTGMDPTVLVDALAAIMAHEEKELCKVGQLALILIAENAATVLTSRERACQLPYVEYLVEQMCALCYDRAWYAKSGGCFAIKCLMERMPLRWVLSHQYLFLKALLFIMMDLTGEVSSGAVDMAKANLEKMLTLCGTPVSGDGTDGDLAEVQRKSLNEVALELVRQVTSPNTCVRDQAMHSLEVLAQASQQSVTALMEPHKEVLADMVPPKKHLLRHQPVNAQIGLMEGNTFCTTLQPRLFTLDLSIPEHKTFFSELVNLCEVEDAQLLKLPCYKGCGSLVPLRKAALRALAACHYLPCREKVFHVLYRALNARDPELQEAGFKCMQQFVNACKIDMEIVHKAIRSLLMLLGDFRQLSLSVIQRLSYLTQLFPHTFNEKLCDQLLQHLGCWLEVAVTAATPRTTAPRGLSTEMRQCAAIVEIFHQIPAASAHFIKPLVTLVLKHEQTLMMEAGSPFHEPLVKFLRRHPVQAIEFLLAEANLSDPQSNRFLEHILKGDQGTVFREVLHQSWQRLMPLLDVTGASSSSESTTTVPLRGDLQYLSVRVISILAKHDDDFLPCRPQLVARLRAVWVSEAFQVRHLRADPSSAEFARWKEPKLLCRCLLGVVRKRPAEIELLFQLLRAFTGRFLPDFGFLREALDGWAARGQTVDWKRASFFRFVEAFHDPAFPQPLLAKVLQYVIVPAFAASFEKDEGEQLIGGPPQPERDSADNVISVFINRVIDPENPFGTSDAVRILLLQFACLLVERASPHIHDAANKRQGIKLRRLMTFAWPCLLGKNCVDPATKYHGHLLLAHIIAKFAIHKRIVLQVFHSLLKAHAVEARAVVRQALEILTPAMPARMEDGNSMLTHWTKKIIVEEGHTLAQLVHMLQLLHRHYKVYYSVRHHLVQHMVSSVQRLGFTPNANLEHKKLAVDLAEVVIRWEMQRHREEGQGGPPSSPDPAGASLGAPKRTLGAISAAGGTSSAGGSSMDLGSMDPKRVRNLSGGASGGATDTGRPIDKHHADALVNFLLRMACQVNETSTNIGSQGEVLSRRCVTLLKTALKPDVWPNSELKLAWFDKLLMTVEGNQPNYGNICTALELLSFLLTILRQETVLASFRPLQRGIAACMTCNNSKVIRSVHVLLSRLMSIFPSEPTTSNLASKYEELECLYASVSKVVFEGLANYEKSNSAAPSSLFGPLMILKAACMSNQCYVDRLITPFMRVLQKMAREHLSPASHESTSMGTELLILSLDLVKNRVGVMGQEMRKAFIGTILVGLIEKSPDAKVLKAITRMVEDWVKSKGPFAVNQSPTLREKSILLVKMMQFVEKRFADDLELNAQFLELVNYVYRDEALKGTELTSKLEPAFMAGLRCVQPNIRAKFFEVLDGSVRRRLHERLLYIVCSQNWETIGPHFWIKQCLELVLASAAPQAPLRAASPGALLPSALAPLHRADAQERADFALAATFKEESMDVDPPRDDEEIDIELPSGEDTPSATSTGVPRGGFGGGTLSSTGLGNLGSVGGTGTAQSLQQLLMRQAHFLEKLREVRTGSFLNATAQLCHLDTALSQHLWVQLFPRLWKILSEKKQAVLGAELIPFLCSGSHVIQKDCHPNAVGTFMEALSQCSPPVPIKPALVKYLGKSHNVWHRSCLLLESGASLSGAGPGGRRAAETSVSAAIADGPSTSTGSGNLGPHDTLDCLAELYALLREEDLWGGLWQRRARYAETAAAVALEQQGFFEQAQSTYEAAMGRAKHDHAVSPASPLLQSEIRLWEEHWLRCSKELSQWDLLLDYSNSKGCANPHLVLESAWRIPNWTLMKEALSQVEQSCPKEQAWRVNLYRGYLAICHPDDHHLSLVDRVVEVITGQCIREWRRLPRVVSHVHLPILQAAQQIMELQEAAQIHQGLLPGGGGRSAASLYDMRAIVKTWRNRLPVLSDDLSHWSDIFTWRQQHYQAIVTHYDSNPVGATPPDPQANQAMLGVHASAQSIIHYGKIARKHGLTNVCLDSLSRIHTIPSVPIVDCFQKIRQQVKCYLQMSNVMGKNELQEGLDVIESTNLKYFAKDMTAEFYALKGLFLAQMGRSEEANKALSAAVQLHDTLVRAWALWGDYLEQLFVRDRWDARQPSLAVGALTCFLHACRHQNEPKARKYLAKVLWLLTYDNEKGTLAEAVDKYSAGVPPQQWLPWVPQLLTCLVRAEGRLLLNLLVQVGRVFPQAVYFPIRTLYLTLKIEQRERYKSSNPEASSAEAAKGSASQTQAQPQGSAENAAQLQGTPQQTAAQGTAGASATAATGEGAQGGQQPPAGDAAGGPIRATPSMWRCSKIMHMQRDLHPTVLSSLEGIVDQMVWFRENWYEEVLRQLRQGLAKCYAVAFENRGAVAEATVTPHTLNFLKKLVSTFGVGIENVSGVATTFSSAASESLARRAQATAQDPVFQKMKGQFTTDFDFSVPGAMKLHNLINKLKKWIKILEAKTKLLPKSLLIEEKCRFLSNFSQQTADVALPGEFLLPKNNHYYVRIARFMPRVEIVQKHNTAARRLYIRGQNGKIYPYLVVNDACLSDARREERVLQLLRMLNHYLDKQKETARRCLHFAVPRVVAVSPQMRLVEDNPASISLLDIYKQRCLKRGVEPDAPLGRYYERLAAVQARGAQASHQVLRDILRDVQGSAVPRTLLRDWAQSTFLCPTDYWTFRKQLTLQLSLAGLAEFVMHLTRLNPDMMYLHQDSGLMNLSYFKFDVDDVTGELDANRPVPFRLTPNLSEFITPVGVAGPMTAAMIATARCLAHPNFKVQALLRAVLRDEMIAWHKKKQDDTTAPGGVPHDMDGELLINMVSKAVNAITTRLQTLATFEGADSKASTLVAAANSHDNLCRMDPAWQPWL